MTSSASAPAPGDPAVFLDRDGTIIVDRHYLSDPDQVELLPGAPGALRALREAGFRLVVVTNQSGIGRGYYTVADMRRVNDRMNALLAARGVTLDGLYFSPEAPEEASATRKPRTGMIRAARAELGLDVARSYMVGDKWADVACGRNAGVRASLLVRTGHGTEEERAHRDRLRDAVVVDDLAQAAAWILADAARR